MESQFFLLLNPQENTWFQSIQAGTWVGSVVRWAVSLFAATAFRMGQWCTRIFVLQCVFSSKKFILTQRKNKSKCLLSFNVNIIKLLDLRLKIGHNKTLGLTIQFSSIIIVIIQYSIRFEVLTAVKMSILVFWLATPSELVGRYQRFGEIYCLHLQSVTTQKINYIIRTKRYIN
jgi:hypothetical protein